MVHQKWHKLIQMGIDNQSPFCYNKYNKRQEVKTMTKFYEMINGTAIVDENGYQINCGDPDFKKDDFNKNPRMNIKKVIWITKRFFWDKDE